MQANAKDRDRAAVLVVAGVCHVLVVEGGRNSAPEVDCVVSLDDFFETVIKSPVSKNEAQTSKSQILPVIAG